MWSARTPTGQYYSKIYQHGKLLPPIDRPNKQRRRARTRDIDESIHMGGSMGGGPYNRSFSSALTPVGVARLLAWSKLLWPSAEPCERISTVLRTAYSYGGDVMPVRWPVFVVAQAFLLLGLVFFVITVGLACFRADDVDQKSNYNPKKSHTSTRFGLFAFVWKYSSFCNIGRARFVQTRCRGTPDEHGLSRSSSPSLPPSALRRIDGCCLRPHAHLHMQARHRNLETWDSSVLVSIQLPC